MGGLYIAGIIFMSLTPHPAVAKYDPSKQDVLSHFSAYFVMMLWHTLIYPARYYLRLAIIFILLGIVLECLQGFMETREFNALDILFNSIGVALAWVFSKYCLDLAFSK
jgi:VanZ family protein